MIAGGEMSKADRAAPIYLSSMFGPDSSWGPDYDVATRMSELGKFWEKGVTPALYDALKHIRNNPTMTPPDWVLEAALKLVEERLKAGYETKLKVGKRNDERAIYIAEIEAYYRWRAVWKHYSAGGTLEDAYDAAVRDLAGTFAEARRDAMKKAYYKIAKELDDPERAFRYYSAMPETREITGTSLLPIAHKNN